MHFFGGTVSFTSKRSNVVALSSAEAEYIAAVAACKELTFVRNVLTDLGFTVKRVCYNRRKLLLHENPVLQHPEHGALTRVMI